ncbi:MAG: elongation factor P hydroxylase [Acidobacteriota bacterium]|nr:elongation factor P hydroxylase [Acidobacteriota bacterium]
MTTHRVGDLIRIFDKLFRETYNTVLVRGEDEPVYLPADDDHPRHRIIFAHGYYASALHEIAHWCVAGRRRRLLEDFGYWYMPDGRTASEQAEFEKVEVKPQALEWIFSAACGKSFRFSADNLNGEPHDMGPFKQAVHNQVKTYFRQGLPKRAAMLVAELIEFYGTKDRFHLDRFVAAEC